MTQTAQLTAQERAVAIVDAYLVKYQIGVNDTIWTQNMYDVVRDGITAAANDMRERCARVAEEHNDGDEFDTVTRLIAKDIRALEVNP